MGWLNRQMRKVEGRLHRNTRVQEALRRIYSGYVNFAYRSIRWTRLGMDAYEADIARGVPRLLCFWHEQLVMMPYLRSWTDHPAAAIASRHADARIMTAHLQALGVRIIEVGSSDVNTGPVREAVRALRAGQTVAITVDGPLGPARQPKPGALVIAGLAGLPVTPCAYAVRRQLRLGTWDRLILPLPWTRGVLAVAEGFQPPRRMDDAAMAEAIARLTEEIDRVEARARRHLAEN